jgi:curved DNA-binding protein CbpA
METIIIDEIEYDPYFILGVTFDDPIEHITKEFRRKAKILHPDKLKGEDKKNKGLVETRTKQFKILVDCYDFVFNRKQSFNFARKNKHEHINVNTHNINTPTNLEEFNKQFSKIGLNNGTSNQQDHPVHQDRQDRNFDDFKREYASSEVKPKKLFNKKKFNDKDREEFNTLFEYHKGNFQHETQIIHKTTDGFNGYNTLDNFAHVSNYNGLLLVDSRQTGHYSDTLKGPKNPESKEVPKDFKRSQNEKKLSKDETDKHIKMLRANYKVSGTGSKSDYLLQERELLDRQREEMKQQAENDKKFILEYQHLFDEQTIRDALSDRLITSKDYTKFD